LTSFLEAAAAAVIDEAERYRNLPTKTKMCQIMGQQ